LPSDAEDLISTWLTALEFAVGSHPAACIRTKILPLVVGRRQCIAAYVDRASQRGEARINEQRNLLLRAGVVLDIMLGRVERAGEPA
jgi:hypothetical protein